MDEINKIKGLLDDCLTLEQLGITWTALNPEQKNLPGILEHKDKLKATLK